MIFSPSFFSPFSTMQYSTLFTGISVFLGFGRKESLDQISLCLLGEITVCLQVQANTLIIFPENIWENRIIEYILCIPSLHSENTYPSPPQYYYQFCSEVVHRHLCILLLPIELFLNNVQYACLPYGFTMKISLRGNSKLVVMHKVKLK